ncbi:MAG: hypothetical protein NT115_07970 [Proteobacteria bacterium]|nr:hypothetical protein [Pseudomonadota bacterium]
MDRKAMLSLPFQGMAAAASAVGNLQRDTVCSSSEKRYWEN